MTQTQFVNASSKSPSESGYDHGCDDADISDPDDRYINQPDKGPSHHTNEFMGGYNDGYDSCSEGFGEDEREGGSSSEGFGDGGSSYDERLSNIVQDFCTKLNRGDYAGAEALLFLLDYGSVSAAGRVLCGAVTLLDDQISKSPKFMEVWTPVERDRDREMGQSLNILSSII